MAILRSFPRGYQLRVIQISKQKKIKQNYNETYIMCCLPDNCVSCLKDGTVLRMGMIVWKRQLWIVDGLRGSSPTGAATKGTHRRQSLRLWQLPALHVTHTGWHAIVIATTSASMMRCWANVGGIVVVGGCRLRCVSPTGGRSCIPCGGRRVKVRFRLVECTDRLWRCIPRHPNRILMCKIIWTVLQMVVGHRIISNV